jgi:hypothetical protein
MYCYMCEISLVVALELLYQCNSTTSRYLRELPTVFNCSVLTFGVQ